MITTQRLTVVVVRSPECDGGNCFGICNAYCNEKIARSLVGAEIMGGDGEHPLFFCKTAPTVSVQPVGDHWMALTFERKRNKLI